jgi:hypothetical protein
MYFLLVPAVALLANMARLVRPTFITVALMAPAFAFAPSTTPRGDGDGLWALVFFYLAFIAAGVHLIGLFLQRSSDDDDLMRPRWLRELHSRLDAMGFTYAFKSFPSSFGNVRHTFTRDDVEITFLTDRSVWEVRVRLAAASETDLGLVQACLENDENRLTVPLDVVDAARFITDNLDKILAFLNDVDQRERVEQMATRRSQLLLGRRTPPRAGDA